MGQKLHGRGEIELIGGQKFAMAPGHVALAEDLTGHGHISRNTGTEDLTFVIVQLADQRPAALAH